MNITAVNLQSEINQLKVLVNDRENHTNSREQKKIYARGAAGYPPVVQCRDQTLNPYRLDEGDFGETVSVTLSLIE